MPPGPADRQQDDLLTPELIGLLEADEKGAIMEHLFKPVHYAVRRYSIRRQLSREESEDLGSEALLYVLERILRAFRAGKLKGLNARFIYLLVASCHCSRFCRGAAGQQSQHVRYDAPENCGLAESPVFADAVHERREREFHTREAIEAAMEQLNPRDWETMENYLWYLERCETELAHESDTKIRSAATRHLALSLGVSLSTAYSRLSQAREHLQEFLDV